MGRIRIALIVLLITASACGCGFVRMTADQIRSKLSGIDIRSPILIEQPDLKSNSVLTGRISGDMDASTLTAVLAYRYQFSKPQNRLTTELAAHTIISGAGNYTLFLPPGDYYLYAFVDRNRDLALESHECEGCYGKPDLISVAPNKVVAGLDVAVTRLKPITAAIPVSLKLDPQRLEDKDTLDRAGQVSLDDGKFSKENANMGIWTPDDFLRLHGVNIYALEPFDPERIPIIFVHGAGGTPKDWQTMAEYIDHRRFQPWFFYYPTSMRLDTLADLLSVRLQVVQEKYGFERLIMTAHSMGGLLARGYINRYSQNDSPYCLKAYISLSTPYDGHDQAKLGASLASDTMPNWQDMATGSDYINRLYTHELPSATRFYLIYGYGGNSLILKDANDGVITVKSQLADRAKAEATRVQGFDADHRMILKSRQVLEFYNTVLETETQKQDHKPAR